MADRKISQLGSLTGVDSTDVIIINDTSEGGGTKKAVLSDVITGLGIPTNLRDSGADVVVNSGLEVQNNIVIGGDLTLETGTVFFGGLQDATNSRFVSEILNTAAGLSRSDSAIVTSGAILDYIDQNVATADIIQTDSVGVDAAAVFYPVMTGTLTGQDSAVTDASINWTPTTSTLSIKGNILPEADSAYDLGSPTKKWKDLYLSGSTINLGGRTFKEVGNNLVIGADQVIATQFVGDGSLLSGVGVQDSAKARAVFLDPVNGQVIPYDSDGAEKPETSLVFTAIPENNVTTPQYQFYLDGVLQSTGVSGDTFTLPDGSEPTPGQTKVVKVTAVENIGAGGNITSNDTVTIYGVQDGGSGINAITAFLTNEAHVEPADSSGNLTTSLTDAGGTYKVFSGITDVTGDAALTYSVNSQSGTTLAIGANGVYTVSAVSADIGTANLRVVVPASLVPRSDQGVTIDKTYTVVKAKQGPAGAGGVGADGVGARAVKVIGNNGYVIRYDSAGTERDTLTFTAIPENGENTLTYDWYVKNAIDVSWGTAVQKGPSVNFTLPDGQEPNVNGVKTIKCEMFENTNGADSAEKAQDVVSVYGLINGTTVTGFLTNSSHVEPADSAGVLTTGLGDAGGEFRVFVGTTRVDADAGVTFANTANSGINVTINSSTGAYGLSSFVSNNTNSGTAEFTATISESLVPGATQPVELVQQYSVSKSRQGVAGVGSGSAGTDASPATASGYVYYALTSVNAPATPSATSYNLTTDVFTGLSANWSTTPPIVDGDDFKSWAARFYCAEQSVGNGTATTVSFSSPFNSTNFSGLVTFTNLNTELADPASSQITTIDGGLISTGTINAGEVNIEYDSDAATTGGFNISSGSSGARLKMTGGRIEVFDESGVLRVKIGKLS